MDLIQQDLRHIWHPCSQMKDYETFPPLQVEGAEGVYLQLADGRKLIDAISSWWCKSLGHGHPRIKAALKQQIDRFEHVILANTTNRNIVKLSSQLVELAGKNRKVSYASDGSCAVEMAVKMSLHSRKISGDMKRTQYMALQHGYHGETGLALALSDLGLYRNHYRELLIKPHFIQGIPYVSSCDDLSWSDASDCWPAIQAQLDPHAESLTAIIVEPILQGAGGMRVYSQDFLRRLQSWCRQHDVHVIADELMTGFGRTGTVLAGEHAALDADFICLGKGLTAGWLPLSAMLAKDEIYQLFYDDYDTGKAFMHSHTYTGNALAVAVALEVLDIMQDERIYPRVQALQPMLLRAFQEVAEKTKKLINIRSIGALVAADIRLENGATADSRLGYNVYQQAVKLGALLRPLGNTLYWLPPLTISEADIHQLRDITIKAIQAAL